MKILKLSIITLNILSLFTQFWLSAAFSDHGPKVAKINSELSGLARENQQLEVLISTAKSIPVIQNKSSLLGLGRVKTVSLEPAMIASLQP